MADEPNIKKKIKANAAKATDSAADKSASLAGAKHETVPPSTSRKKGKLLPKHKHRLPRRQKKAQQEGTARLCFACRIESARSSG
jgi:hypothetical protein